MFALYSELDHLLTRNSHYSDPARQKLDFKLTYDLPDGTIYTGLNPPSDATIKGVLYPRTATLGGCTAHNALVTIYPDESDFQYIANLTGDKSWSPSNMRNYWVKLEQNRYNPANTSGHGYDGWLSVENANKSIAFNDNRLLGMLFGAVDSLGPDTNANYNALLNGDANAYSVARDQTQAIYQIPIATYKGARNGAREFIVSVANAKNADGSKKYPLDVRTNCFVTKVNFNTTGSKGSLPTAIGVNFLDGKSLYRADPRSKKSATNGTPGSARASREVIVAGGSYNSPQILKLSGIGPAAELKKFNISVIADLPGVGSNLQDHYEVVVQGSTAAGDFVTLDNCTLAFDSRGQPTAPTSDPCYQRWLSAGPGGDRGPYASSGFAAGMFIKNSDSIAPDANYGALAFGGPINFRGYFPGYAYNASQYHNYWSWAILKSHPRNTAGSVTLRSADPLDTPEIQFNYFDAGSAGWEKDVAQIAEAIGVARDAFAKQSTNFTEILPGVGADVNAYIKNTAWGHHCSSTCAIGADGDAMAVLDSSFRVRKVKGLRVVDASIYPKIPGKMFLVRACLRQQNREILGSHMLIISASVQGLSLPRRRISSLRRRQTSSSANSRPKSRGILCALHAPEMLNVENAQSALLNAI
jgi:choline dehydrogenase